MAVGEDTEPVASEEPVAEPEADPWAPIPLDPPPSALRRLFRRRRRVAWAATSGVLAVLLAGALVLYAGERLSRRQADDELLRARATLAIAQTDRSAALTRAQAAA